MYFNREYEFNGIRHKVSVHFEFFLGMTYTSTEKLEVANHGQSDKPLFQVPEYWIDFQEDYLSEIK